MGKFLLSLFIGVCLLLAINSPLADIFLKKLESDAITADKKIDPLIDEIRLKGKEYERPPQNAVIDPVWKAIPGYNGLKVDVEASYKKMKETGGGFDPEKLVFFQEKPKITLKDLPPAPVYKGNPEKPMVSFVINVAWGNEYIPQILATLKENRVFATFFLEGRWVKNHPDLAKMIVDAGHEVGNHSFTHPDMKILSAGKIREEIVKTNEVIKATTGKSVSWFAPPSGSYREEVVKIAAEEGLGTIMWSVDTIDWKEPAPSVLINRVVTKIHPGALVLMHPTKSTADALDQLIKKIKEKNLEIHTVSKLLSEERVMRNVLEKDQPKNN